MAISNTIKLPKGVFIMSAGGSRLTTALLIISVVFAIIVAHQMYKQISIPEKKEEKEVVEIIRHVPSPIRRRRPHRGPDFRRPPTREYRPTNYEQLGLLTAPGQDSRALFGRSVEAHRDRFNYYTATLGNQSFPVPVTFKGQDCMDRYIGCAEIYGDNEDVVAKDNNVTYKAMMYQVN
jgi:hypothetical protein